MSETVEKNVLGIITSHGFQEKVPNADNADIADIAGYASEDKTKGTIEERLTAMGFKQGEFTFVQNDYIKEVSSPVIRQVGKVIYGKFNIVYNSSVHIPASTYVKIGSLSNINMFNDNEEYVLLDLFAMAGSERRDYYIILKNNDLYFKHNRSAGGGATPSYTTYNENIFNVDLLNKNTIYLQKELNIDMD